MYRIIIVAALVVVACDDPSPPVQVASSRPAPTLAAIPVLFDRTPVASIASARPGASLREFVPQDPQTWASVRVEASGRRHFEIAEPHTRHPNAKFELTMNARGQLAVILRSAADATLPPAVAAAARKPIASLDDVTAIHITSIAQARAAPEREVRIMVTVDGKDHTIVDPQELKPVTLRGGAETGYTLASVVAQHADITRVADVTIVGMNDVSHRVSGSDLLASATDRGPIFLVRVNRNGALRFRHYTRSAEDVARPGAPSASRRKPTLHTRIRDVQRIVVTTTAP